LVHVRFAERFQSKRSTADERDERRWRRSRPEFWTRIDRMDGIRMDAGKEAVGRVGDPEDLAVGCGLSVQVRLRSFDKLGGEPFFWGRGGCEIGSALELPHLREFP
jgi:hypothetical protein